MSEGLESLGTPKAAVESCVNVIACAVSFSEQQLHYWLDMYYQLRCRYEEWRAETDSGTGPEEADSPAELGTVTGELIEAAAQRLGAAAELPAGASPSVSACTEPPARTPEPADQQLPEVRTRDIKGSKFGDYKRETLELLAKARAQGLTIGRLERLSGYKLTQHDICTMASAGSVDIQKWQRLNDILSKHIISGEDGA